MSVAVEQPAILPGIAELASAATTAQFPARPLQVTWPATSQSRDDLLARLSGAPFLVEKRDKQVQRVFGVKLLVNWLADQPGRTWQERWLASGADVAGAGWREVPAEWLQPTAIDLLGAATCWWGRCPS